MFFPFAGRGSLAAPTGICAAAAGRRACFNGASEMVTNLSMAVTTFLFNAIMMAYLGEAGVSAITIVLYAQFLWWPCGGLLHGGGPGVQLQPGAGRYDRMRRIFRLLPSAVYPGLSVAILAVALALSGVVVGISPHPALRCTPSPWTARRFAPAFLCRGKYLLPPPSLPPCPMGAPPPLSRLPAPSASCCWGRFCCPGSLEVDGVWLAVLLA